MCGGTAKHTRALPRLPDCLHVEKYVLDPAQRKARKVLSRRAAYDRPCQPEMRAAAAAVARRAADAAGALSDRPAALLDLEDALELNHKAPVVLGQVLLEVVL